MERKNSVLKITAIVSAVLLAGAFVSYRAGAFARFTKPEPQPTTAPTPDTGDQPPQTFMFGSKSAPVVPANPAGSENPPTYMGGSKYIVVAPNPPDAPKPAPTYLGGSKSIIIAPNGPELPKPAPNAPKP